jgi:ectoine hydroxylase-related dioxygenase (phytanoyl-CoA dioxygenase family)
MCTACLTGRGGWQFNSRKMRHHRPIQLELLYYPQRVTVASGATGTIPYSHYWHFNHEENHDNFAGADHLDLDFMYGG